MRLTNANLPLGGDKDGKLLKGKPWCNESQLEVNAAHKKEKTLYWFVAFVLLCSAYRVNFPQLPKMYYGAH